METNIVIAVLALVFSAFFSGYEISFLSGNKLKVELDRKQGKRYARVMERFIQNPQLVISSLLVGNNVAIVIYGMAAAKILEFEHAAYLRDRIKKLREQMEDAQYESKFHRHKGSKGT